MFPIQIFIIVSQVIIFAINAFEYVRTWFPLFGLKSREVQFEVYLAAPGHISVIFDFIGATAFLIFEPMSFARKDGVIPFPTIMALRYSWIHICSSDSGDRPVIVKRVVD